MTGIRNCIVVLNLVRLLIINGDLAIFVFFLFADCAIHRLVWTRLSLLIAHVVRGRCCSDKVEVTHRGKHLLATTPLAIFLILQLLLFT